MCLTQPCTMRSQGTPETCSRVVANRVRSVGARMGAMNEPLLKHNDLAIWVSARGC